MPVNKVLIPYQNNVLRVQNDYSKTKKVTMRHSILTIFLFLLLPTLTSAQSEKKHVINGVSKFTLENIFDVEDYEYIQDEKGNYNVTSEKAIIYVRHTENKHLIVSTKFPDMSISCYTVNNWNSDYAITHVEKLDDGGCVLISTILCNGVTVKHIIESIDVHIRHSLDFVDKYD